MIFRLNNDNCSFPDPRQIPPGEREPDGFFAIGGDLSPRRLLTAYSYGIFPWYAFRSGLIKWFCPMDRFVIFPAEIHVSHSMRTLINKHKLRLSIDENFPGVIGNCSRLRISERGAWLGPDMVEAYTRLHNLGRAHSVEVWQEDKLVGGLYGIYLRRAFFGESMFSLVPSASKLALIHLARHLQGLGASFIDCQFETPHLKSMGGRHISYDEYLSLLGTME